MVRMDAGQPAVFELASDDEGYRIAKPHCETVNRRKDGAIEYRHYMDDVFNGLSDNGLLLLRIEDTGRFRKPALDARPGSWTHESAYVGGGFVIVAMKNQRDS